MSFGIYQVSHEFDKLDRETAKEVLSDIQLAFKEEYNKARSEYVESGKISSINEVEDWLSGVLNDGREYEVYISIGEKLPSMGKGMGCWLSDFRWI